MTDMRALPAEEDTSRNGLIIAEAIATALVYRTQQAIGHAVSEAGFNNWIAPGLRLPNYPVLRKRPFVG